MPDILVVKCNAFLPQERMQAIKRLEAQIVPDDIEIRLASSDEDGLMFVDVDEII